MIDCRNSTSSQGIPWHWRPLRGRRELDRATCHGWRANRRSISGETEALQSSWCLPNHRIGPEPVDDRSYDVAVVPRTSGTTHPEGPWERLLRDSDRSHAIGDVG